MGWFADEERKIELQQRIQKEMMFSICTAQVLIGVKQYYKDPFAYNENKKLELILKDGQ